MSMLEAVGLGVRYGQTWAVRDCTLAVPEGHIVALVGSNGAGKTTLLHCAMGLTYPTCGTVSVLGGLPAGSLDALERVAFVAQDAPLYRQLSVKEMVEVGHVHACRDTRRGPPVAIFDPTGLGFPDDFRTLLNCPGKCSFVGGCPVTVEGARGGKEAGPRAHRGHKRCAGCPCVKPSEEGLDLDESASKQRRAVCSRCHSWLLAPGRNHDVIPASPRGASSAGATVMIWQRTPAPKRSIRLSAVS